MDELRSEKINECTEPLWKTTPIKIDNLYIKLYTEEQWNVTEAHQTMRVASETIKRVCIQWVVKARCTMIPFRVCRSDGWRNRVSDRPVCHHLIRNRSKKKEMLDCIFSHSHSNPLAGHRSSYMSSILIQSIIDYHRGTTWPATVSEQLTFDSLRLRLMLSVLLPAACSWQFTGSRIFRENLKCFRALQLLP